MKRIILSGIMAAGALAIAVPLAAQQGAQGGAAGAAPAAPPAAAPAGGGRGGGAGRGGGGGGGGGGAAGLPVPGGYPAFPVDPAKVERGRVLYTSSTLNCVSCHAADLRGGDRGNNLLRSRYVLNDTGNGGLVGAQTRYDPGHGRTFVDLSEADAGDLAHYLKSFPFVTQGRAPNTAVPAVFVAGNPAAGQAYFTRNCASCHAVTAGATSSATNLAGIGAGVEPTGNAARTLQQRWLSPNTTRPTIAAVTMNDGTTISAPATAANEFTITLTVDGAARQIDMKDVRRVEFTYPLAAHAALLRTITDTNIHDVTGYLVSLK